MNRMMTIGRMARASAAATAILAASAARGADDRPPPPIEVVEWSVWVGSPSQPTLNASRTYRNALPASVGTSRPKAEGDELARKFPIAPASVVQFFGEAAKDVDVDLRVKKGSILAHWPRGAERTGRVQWFKSDFLAAPPAGSVGPANLDASHWLSALRDVGGALYLKNEARVERFLAYDVEVAAPVPVKLRGGPDEYTLQNLTAQPLLDVAVIAPDGSGGYRVGWLDALPTAVPAESAAEKDAKAKAKANEAAEKATPESKARAAAAIMEPAADAKDGPKKDGEKKDGEKKAAEPKPLPTEGDAEIRARVDQLLNRQVTLGAAEAPRRDVLGLVASQARFRYEVDEPTLAKADVDLAKPMATKAGQVAARDALADILGGVGLSYRVDEDGSLFITTAARLADESSKKGAVIEGPPVKLTLGPAMRPADPAFAAAARDAYSKRLAARGLRAEAIKSYLDQYARPLFEPPTLIVVAHLSRDAIDDLVPLDVFPTPRKVTRVAAVVAQGIDPRLQDHARELVKALGAPASKARETAESQLFDLGPVAVPALEDALKEADVEIVYRAERVLMRLNRPVP